MTLEEWPGEEDMLDIVGLDQCLVSIGVAASQQTSKLLCVRSTQSRHLLARPQEEDFYNVMATEAPSTVLTQRYQDMLDETKAEVGLVHARLPVACRVLPAGCCTPPPRAHTGRASRAA